jgi:ABC-type glutathione transport system ATPase component
MDQEKFIEKALKLEPDSVYAVETDTVLSKEQRAAIVSSFKRVQEMHGITFVLLEGGMKIAKYKDTA